MLIAGFTGLLCCIVFQLNFGHQKVVYGWVSLGFAGQADLQGCKASIAPLQGRICT